MPGCAWAVCGLVMTRLDALFSDVRSPFPALLLITILS